MFFEIASKNGYKEIVKILIKYDADVNLRDKDGNTALIWGLYWYLSTNLERIGYYLFFFIKLVFLDIKK